MLLSALSIFHMQESSKMLRSSLTEPQELEIKNGLLGLTQLPKQKDTLLKETLLLAYQYALPCSAIMAKLVDPSAAMKTQKFVLAMLNTKLYHSVILLMVFQEPSMNTELKKNLDLMLESFPISTNIKMLWNTLK